VGPEGARNLEISRISKIHMLMDRKVSKLASTLVPFTYANLF